MRRSVKGQAVMELVLVLPLLMAVALGGLALCRLAVSQAEVHLAAIVGCASPDPAGAARAYLRRNRLVDSSQTTVQVRSLGQLRLTTVTCSLSPGWWPNDTRPRFRLLAVAGRGRALLCTRPRR